MQWAKQAYAAVSAGAQKAWNSRSYDGAVAGVGSAYNWMRTTNWGGTVGSALIGGTASMMTGGTFTSGAMAGVAGGWAASGLRSKRSAGMSMAGVSRNSLMGRAIRGGTRTRARAMFGGAALSGAVFGNRRKHSRGFNSSRGARM